MEPRTLWCAFKPTFSNTYFSKIKPREKKGKNNSHLITLITRENGTWNANGGAGGEKNDKNFVT